MCSKRRGNMNDELHGTSHRLNWKRNLLRLQRQKSLSACWMPRCSILFNPKEAFKQLGMIPILYEEGY